MVRKNNETQIKGEKQLEDLTNPVKFISSKFDEYGQIFFSRWKSTSCGVFIAFLAVNQ